MQRAAGGAGAFGQHGHAQCLGADFAAHTPYGPITSRAATRIARKIRAAVPIATLTVYRP